MLILAAALAAAPLAPQTVVPERQARAMVRIVPGTMLRFGELEKAKPMLFREAKITSPDGTGQVVKLVEFE